MAAETIVKIDGSYGEGGGQIFRTSLALSAILKRPLEIFNIRVGRREPGLKPQHLMSANATAAVTGGRLEGAALNSQALNFFPGYIVSCRYNFYFSNAREIWVEVNKQMPWTYGPKFPDHKITKRIDVDYPLAEYSHDISEDEKNTLAKIGTYINQFISEDCTIQLGIGKLQSILQIKPKISVYSEMIGDWAMNLKAEKIVSGAVISPIGRSSTFGL